MIKRLLSLFVLITAVAVARGQVNVLTQHNNNQRTGANLSETILNVSNVNATHFGLLWQYQVEGQIYAQPLYMEAAPILVKPNTGPPFVVKKNVLYVATMHNLVVAFDAGGIGATPPPSPAPLWTYDAGSGKSNSGLVPVESPDVYGASPEAFNISPAIGIVSTPVIDPELNVMYVVAMTKNPQTGELAHHLHEINIATGTANRPPVKIEGPRSPFPPLRLQRAALLLDRCDLYVAFASFGDRQPYAIEAKNTAETSVFPRGVVPYRCAFPL
jgi:PQQ-like domain